MPFENKLYKIGILIFNNKDSKIDNSKIIVGLKAYSVKTKMNYLVQTLTNDLKINQHLKEKNTNLQSILHV